MTLLHPNSPPHKLSALLLIALGFILQAGMIYAFLQEAWWRCFELHVLASLLFPWPVWLLLPAHFTDKSPVILVLFFLLCFCIPLLSGVALLVSVTLCSRYTKPQESNYFNIINLPTIPDNILESTAYTLSIPSNIRATIEASTVEQKRIQAVLGTRKMNDQLAIPILQAALLDTLDEVRLLAYAMLNGKEKKISGSIQANLNNLKNKQFSTLEKATIQHYIAEAYWELAYLGLEQGQARLHVLETAYHYAQKAVSVYDTDGSLFFLTGRIALELGHYAVADQHFKQAKQHGVSHEKLLPYLAELAFAEHRRDEVNSIIQQMQKATDQHIRLGTLK